MSSTVILIHTACLIALLYLTTVLLISKKSSLRTVFFTVNKAFNVAVCIFTSLIIMDFCMAQGFMAAPSVFLFTLFKYVMNGIVTAMTVALYLMVYIRYTIVTSARLPATHRNEAALLKYVTILLTTSVTVAMPVLFVEFRYDENIKYYVSDATSLHFLIFDLLEALCLTTCFSLSSYYTTKTIWFMHVHKKPWNMFLLHIALSNLYSFIGLQFGWMRVVWRLFACDSCSTYANSLRSFSSPVVLTVTFSIIVCSKEVRDEVLYPLRICRKLPINKPRQTSKISIRMVRPETHETK